MTCLILPVIVIPVRAELGNGNLEKLLRDIHEQSVPAQTVLIINNSIPERLYETDIWKENLRTVSWAEKKKNSSLSVMDLTEGCERNMGKIRNAGMALAKKKNPDPDTPIVHLDADCRIGSGFTKAVMNALSFSPFALQPMLYLPFAGDPFIRKTFFDHHLPLLARECVRLLSGLPATRTGAPQLAATSAAWSQIGGFPELVEGEDFAAGQILFEKFGFSYNSNPDAVVFTADRITDRGFESAARADSRRDDDGTSPVPRYFDNPLFHLVVAAVSGGCNLNERKMKQLESAFGQTLPVVKTAVNEGYKKAQEAGIPALLKRSDVFLDSLTTAAAILHPGITDEIGEIRRILDNRYSLEIGNETDRKFYKSLAAWMIGLMNREKTNAE